MRKHSRPLTNLRQIHSGILQRCYNPKSVGYRFYGAKGITVHDSWRGADGCELFAAHIGPRPSYEHSVDRYPNKQGNYEPGNVRWATRVEQARNKENYGGGAPRPTTTIYLGELEPRLRTAVALDGRSIAEFVREAVELRLSWGDMLVVTNARALKSGIARVSNDIGVTDEEYVKGTLANALDFDFSPPEEIKYVNSSDYTDIHLPENEKKDAERLAKLCDISLGALLRLALVDFIRKHEDESELDQARATSC